jgi:hypothetical protein
MVAIVFQPYEKVSAVFVANIRFSVTRDRVGDALVN